MERKVKPIPPEYHSVSPVLIIRNAADAITFYMKAFDAEVMFRQDRPDGKLMHAALKIGDSVVMLGEECAPHEGHAEECVRAPADLKGTTVNLYLYVKDVDQIFRQALEAGAEPMMPVEDMFWGDRMGMVKDPYGHVWSVATHTQQLTQEQIEARMHEYMAHQA
jgi:uncharacterized glyoxalase superfamily protein PhnB